MGQNRQESSPSLFHFASEIPSQLPLSDIQASGRSSPDRIEYCFSLGKI
jgi:hypothetical protein